MHLGPSIVRILFHYTQTSSCVKPKAKPFFVPVAALPWEQRRAWRFLRPLLSFGLSHRPEHGEHGPFSALGNTRTICLAHAQQTRIHPAAASWDRTGRVPLPTQRSRAFLAPVSCCLSSSPGPPRGRPRER